MKQETRKADAYDAIASRVGNALNIGVAYEKPRLESDSLSAPVDAGHDQPVRMDADTMTPEYYRSGGVETIDYLHAFLTEDEFNGFCKGNVIKYVSRASRKNGIEDIRKARSYIGYLITSMEGEWS